VTNSNELQGHEGCGEIVQIGEQVRDAGFNVVSCPLLSDASYRTSNSNRATESQQLPSLDVVQATAQNARETLPSCASERTMLGLVRTDSMHPTLR